MTATHKYTIWALVLFTLVNCSNNDYARKIEGSYAAQKSIKRSVVASVETDPVNQPIDVDAADDPAIWIHPTDPSKSIVIGTDKKSGLSVYSLNGKLLHFYKTGAMNNVDLRYNYIHGTDTFDIAAASNRTTNTVDLYRINPNNGSLIPINNEPIVSSVDKVYGFCLYQSTSDSSTYAFINSKNGQVEQWLLTPAPKQTIDGILVRTFSLPGQVEGMVTDDEQQTFFIGEEEHGIWKFGAQPNPADTLGQLLSGSTSSNPNISFDIEGIALYKSSSTSGYLIASSQGNFSYAVFTREPPHSYLGSFCIGDSLVDGAEETDGLDITNAALNSTFPSGMLVVQDGINKDSIQAMPQNFKYIDWARIANSFDPPLQINTAYPVRR